VAGGATVLYNNVEGNSIVAAGQMVDYEVLTRVNEAKLNLDDS
jgi:hypothetical protein